MSKLTEARENASDPIAFLLIQDQLLNEVKKKKEQSRNCFDIQLKTLLKECTPQFTHFKEMGLPPLRLQFLIPRHLCQCSFFSVYF